MKLPSEHRPSLVTRKMYLSIVSRRHVVCASEIEQMRTATHDRLICCCASTKSEVVQTRLDEVLRFRIDRFLVVGLDEVPRPSRQGRYGCWIPDHRQHRLQKRTQRRVASFGRNLRASSPSSPTQTTAAHLIDRDVGVCTCPVLQGLKLDRKVACRHGRSVDGLDGQAALAVVLLDELLEELLGEGKLQVVRRPVLPASEVTSVARVVDHLKNSSDSSTSRIVHFRLRTCSTRNRTPNTTMRVSSVSLSNPVRNSPYYGERVGTQRDGVWRRTATIFVASGYCSKCVAL